MYSTKSVSTEASHRKLVFIDTNLEDYHHLVNGIKLDAEPFLLHQEEDGVKQITQVLSQYSHVESIHIVSHGAPGTLYLGNAELSLDTLEGYAWELQTWFDSVSDGITPALVIYGCHVAIGDAGTEFVEKLHQLTHATVYASSTPVGNSAKGGRWDLDVRRGEAQDSFSLVFQPQVLETYTGVLAIGTDNNYTFYDSTETSGKGTVAFTDISATGDPISIEPNSEKGNVNLPFTFRFYDKDFNSISVSDNGGIIFGSSLNFIGISNSRLPREEPQYSIFPFWDDLKGGNVYYKQDGARFIVQWNNVIHGDLDGSDATFQVVLHKNSNNIDFVYKDVNFGDSTIDNGASATIGINKNENSGIQYLFNGKTSTNETRTLSGVTSIRFLTEPKLVNKTITLKEGETITLTESNFKATDVDNTVDLSKIKFIITNPKNGEFRLNGTAVTEFTQADINASKVQFVHDGGEIAPAYDVAITDGYNPTVSQSVNTTNLGISFTNINDNPQLTGLVNSVTFKENDLNLAAATIYSNITLNDVDSPDFNAGNLTLSYSSASEITDQLSIANNGSISVNGSNVSYNSTVIGSIDATNNGRNGKSLVVNFSSTGATLVAVKTLIENLTYQTISDTPGPSRTISVTVNDGDGGPNGGISLAATTEIKVTAENDKPVNNLPQPRTIDEDNSLTFSERQISISDPDAGANSVQVTLTTTEGRLSLSGKEGLSFSDDDGTDGTLKFTGSIANINNALNGMTFTPKADFNGVGLIKVETQDQGNSGEGGNLVAENTLVYVNVNAVNDAPMNALPSAPSVNEDTDLVFINSNAITISDVDASEGTGEVQVTLSVTKGLLTLKNTTGITFSPGNASGNAAMTFRGKVADINKALESLTYRGVRDFNGEDTLSITTNDLGNAGKVTALTTTNTVKIKVNPVNDKPVNTVPTDQNYNADTDLVFSSAGGNAITISDLDADEGTGEVEVMLSVGKGVLTLKNTTGVTFTPGNANGNTTITFRGKVADINKALEGLTYRGNQSYNGQDMLEIVTNDLGNRGEGNSLSDTDTVYIGLPDFDSDGINNTTESKIAIEIALQGSADAKFKSLSQRAANEGGIVALFAGDGGQKKPIVIAIDDEDQQQLGGNSQKPVLVINDVETEEFQKIVGDPIAAFDNKDLKKSALKKVTAALDIINFEVMPDSTITDKSLQQKVVDGIKQKPFRVEIKLPDSPEDVAVNTICLRKADGTLVDFRRQINPKRGQLDGDMLTGAVLQDRNLDGKADWAVVYLQDGEWGDEDGLANGEIQKSLVAVNWDLGMSRMEVRSNQDGLNFYGNRSFVQFTLNRYSGVDASEIGMARVRFGDNGQIMEVNGKAVNSLDEAKQVIVQRGETLFSSLTNRRNPDFGTQTRTVAFEEGEQVVFFAIQGGTKDELLFNGLTSKTVQFSLPSLNGGAAIFQASVEESRQTAKLSLAGMFDISANILTSEKVQSQLGMFAVSQSQSQMNMTGELIDLKSSAAFDDKQVMLKFSIQREARNNNSAYLYQVDDAKGSIKDPVTGMLIDPTTELSAEQKQRYLQLATSDRLVKDVQFETSNFTNKEVSITLNGGGYYVPFLVSNGTLSSIGNDFSRVLTSYMGINGDRFDHVRNLGNGVFGFEDITGGGDRDYNDMILSLQQVQIMT